MKLIVSIFISFCSIISLGQQTLEEHVNQILGTYVKDDLGPGITVGIVKNNQLIYQNHKGLMNLEYQLPFNDSTIFGLASVTKQFTAACIGILEKKEKLNIYDDVRKYIPELPFYEDTVRIFHLLNHTSGIRNHNVLLNLKGFDYAHQGYTNSMIQALTFEQKGVNNLPGEKMLYSNTNYVLLALIIERVSGQTLPNFAQNELFTPLRMHHTFYRSDLENLIPNRAYSYYRKEDKYYQPQSLTLCIGAGGMGSTIHDLALWSTLFTDSLHPFSYLKVFITHTDTLNNGKAMKHARGMFVNTYKGQLCFNHSGRDLGMRSQFICLPNEEVAIIVYTNSEHINAVNLSYEILDFFVEKEQQQSIPRYEKPGNINLNQFEGTYQELNSDLRMYIYAERDTIWALSSFGSEASPLKILDSTSFCRPNNTSIHYYFDASNEQLTVDFGGAQFYFEKVKLHEDTNINLKEYTGKFYSPELDVIYTLEVIDNVLTLSYANYKNIPLSLGTRDSFGNNLRTRYDFVRDETGAVSAFTVSSEGTVSDILFKKIE